MSSQPDGKSPDLKSDVYASQERAWMLKYQAWKQKFLHSLLIWLDSKKVTPDHITIASLATGVAFALMYSQVHWSIAIFVGYPLLILHLIIDGIDGPLARHQGVASNAGSLTDTLADQIVIAATTAAFMSAPLGDPEKGGTTGGIAIWSGTMYVFLYTLVVVFAMVRNRMQIPYMFVIRPRNFVYGAMFLQTLFASTYSWPMEMFMWLCNGILCFHAVAGYFALREKI